MVNHWNIKIFTVYIQKHTLTNQIKLKNECIHLHINILNQSSVSCKETDSFAKQNTYYKSLIINSFA